MTSDLSPTLIDVILEAPNSLNLNRADPKRLAGALNFLNRMANKKRKATEHAESIANNPAQAERFDAAEAARVVRDPEHKPTELPAKNPCKLAQAAAKLQVKYGHHKIDGTPVGLAPIVENCRRLIRERDERLLFRSAYGHDPKTPPAAMP